MTYSYSLFLPVGPVQQRAVGKPTAKQMRDVESTPERQMARRLGNYGADLLRDRIKVDYLDQRRHWEKHIENVVAAFSVALGHQAAVLKKTEGERLAAAELQMFLFSLVTAGVMRWARSFIQYKVFPKFASRPTKKFIHVTDQDWPLGMSKLIEVSEFDFRESLNKTDLRARRQDQTSA